MQFWATGSHLSFRLVVVFVDQIFYVRKFLVQILVASLRIREVAISFQIEILGLYVVLDLGVASAAFFMLLKLLAELREQIAHSVHLFVHPLVLLENLAKVGLIPAALLDIRYGNVVFHVFGLLEALAPRVQIADGSGGGDGGVGCAAQRHLHAGGRRALALALVDLGLVVQQQAVAQAVGRREHVRRGEAAAGRRHRQLLARRVPALGRRAGSRSNHRRRRLFGRRRLEFAFRSGASLVEVVAGALLLVVAAGGLRVAGQLAAAGRFLFDEMRNTLALGLEAVDAVKVSGSLVRLRRRAVAGGASGCHCLVVVVVGRMVGGDGDAAVAAAARRGEVLQLVLFDLLALVLRVEEPVLLHVVPRVLGEVVGVVAERADRHERVDDVRAVALAQPVSFEGRLQLRPLVRPHRQQMDDALLERFADEAGGRVDLLRGRVVDGATLAADHVGRFEAQRRLGGQRLLVAAAASAAFGLQLELAVHPGAFGRRVPVELHGAVLALLLLDGGHTVLGRLVHVLVGVYPQSLGEVAVLEQLPAATSMLHALEAALLALHRVVADHVELELRHVRLDAVRAAVAAARDEEATFVVVELDERRLARTQATQVVAQRSLRRVGQLDEQDRLTFVDHRFLRQTVLARG